MGDKPTAPDDALREELRIRIKECLHRLEKKQSTLAHECGVADADLAHFLSGDRPLPKFALVNLALVLEMDPSRVLLLWDLSQSDVKLGDLKAAGENQWTAAKAQGWERVRAVYQSALGQLPAVRTGATSRKKAGTLVDWPSLLPRMVFVGDRRERPPSSTADLLAVSASLGDLFYFTRLRLPVDTQVRSDKTCVLTSAENLRTLLQDENLLIIGSPAANLVARVVNSGACFSFASTLDAMEQEEEFQKKLDPIRYLPDELARYGGENPSTDEEAEWSRQRNHMIYGFARSGILDPMRYAGLRGTSLGAHSDYGVVTLCRHPWSEKRVAIMAAGLHGPATAAAVKLLADPGAFMEHPLGGVFRVHVPIEAPWEERYEHLNPQWDTKPYSLETYSTELERFAGKYEAQLREAMRYWNPDHVRLLLRLVTAQVPNEEARTASA